MPQLKRYVQQFAPSGRVGVQEVNPEALTNTGAELPFRGIEAVGGAVGGLADVFQQTQDLEDEIAVNSAERLVGEHLSKLWSDIELEPDYTRHQAMYSKAFETANSFAPKSPRAARVFQLRMNQNKPGWDRQFYTTTTRRRINSIDSDTQANIALDSDRLLRAVEKNDGSESTLASKRIDDTLAERVKFGLMTQAESDLTRMKIREQAQMTGTKADALEILSIEGLDGAEQFVSASNLTDEQKDHIRYDLRLHASDQIAQSKQAAAFAMEADRQNIFGAVQDKRFDELPDMIRNSSLSGDEKYAWLTRFESRAEAVKNGKHDPFQQTDQELFGQLWRAVNAGDEAVTEERLAGFVGKGLDGGISVADFKELVNLRQQRTKDGPTVKSKLVDSYLDQITAMESDAGGEAGFLSETIYSGANWKEYTQFGKAAPKVLGGDMKRAFQRWYAANPQATPDEMDTAFQSLVGAVQKRAIPAFLNEIRTRELTLSQETAARAKAASLPLTVETAPVPRTMAEFEDTVRRIENRDEAKKYYERYKSWQR